MKMAGFACVFAWLATAILAHQWQLSKYEDGIGQRNYLSSDDTAAEAHSSHFRRKKHLSDNNCGCTYNYAKKATSGPAVGAIKLRNYFSKHFTVSRTEIHNNRTVRGSTTLSLHAEGRAVDFFVSKQIGLNIFNHAVAIACSSGIQEVIFNRRIWTHGKGDHHYSGINPHTDHVHIGLNNCGAQKFNKM